MAGKNQGEGDKESAARYNKEQQEFVKSGRVDDAAREATEDLDAEREGRERAKAFDPEEEKGDAASEE